MEPIVRFLDMNARIGQTCYFCGEKRSVKYLVTDAIGDDGKPIEKEVPCCNKCILQHIWANDKVGDV